MDNIIDEGYKKSIELLVKNSTKFGLLASSVSPRAKARNYLSICGRDASICALGMVVSKKPKLVSAARRSLINLGKYQAANGQIPNFIKPEKQYADFWYVGCIDATLWWLIAIKYFDKYNQDEKKLAKKMDREIASALAWLKCQEHQKFFLLQQNEASDWADIMPRSGYVLYSNVLWFWVKNLYKIPSAVNTRENIEYLFAPWKKPSKNYLRRTPRALTLIKYLKATQPKSDFYLSFVHYTYGGRDLDIFSNILACLADVPPKKKMDKIINGLGGLRISKKYPVQACLRPISQKDKSWRAYMEIHKQNFPDQYHNGGIWPFIGGFWIMTLARAQKKDIAKKELEKLALANSQNNWQFNEWFHGQTGKPLGMSGQSWNAGMYILAYHFLKKDFKL